MQDSLEIVEKAMIHILGEEIGFEEAEIYWKMIRKESLEEINRSKKYRILKELFELGHLLRIKKHGIFEYIPVPPTFIYLESDIKKEHIDKQEKIYLKNYFNLFKEGDFLLEASGKVINGIVLFFIKNFMKKKADILLGGPDIFDLIEKETPAKFDNINFIGINKYFKKKGYCEKNLKLTEEEIISDRRFCIIDDELIICFFKSLGEVYEGYITSNKDRIELKKKEFNYILKSS